jgi:hypothetical protein
VLKIALRSAWNGEAVLKIALSARLERRGSELQRQSGQVA